MQRGDMMLLHDDSRLALRRAEVWKTLGISRSMLGRLERSGDGPPRRRVSAASRLVLYPLDGLRRWLESRAA